MRLLIVLVLALIGAEAFAVCGQILKDVQAPVVGGVGRYFLGAGEIYPATGRNKEGTKYTLQVGSETVAVDRSLLRLMEGEICSQKKAPLPSAAESTASSPARDGQNQTKEFIPLEGLNQEAPRSASQDSIPDQAVTARDEDLSEETPESEENLSPSPKRTRSSRQSEASPGREFSSPWRFGVEAGYVMNISGDPYSGLVTAIPDPTNVGPLQDPIITEIKEGSGYQLRVFGEKMLNPFLVSQIGLGYRQQAFKYVAKVNPSTSVVRLDELSGYEEKIQSDLIELGAGVSYLQFVGDWTFGYGVHLDLLYDLTGKKKIDVLLPSGPILKNTAFSVEDGPEPLTYQLRGKIDARRGDYRLTLAVAQDASFTLSLGYLFK